MNIELENLIDMALADGKVTDKERQVLQRKVQELGVDQDEFEMVLEAKLHLAQKSAAPPPQPASEHEKPKSQKHGNLKKCPSCGEGVVSMSLNCSACGHEYTNIKSNPTILDLLEKIEQIEKNKNSSLLHLSAGKKLVEGQEFEDKKNELIQNYPVPNSKEDILEILTYSLSKVTSMSQLDNPWAVKADEVIMKSRFLFKNDKEMLIKIDEFEKQLKRRKKGPIIVIAICFIIIFGGAALVMIFGGNLINK